MERNNQVYVPQDVAEFVDDVRQPGDWRNSAECRPDGPRSGLDPNLFFPIGNTGLALQQIERAKAVCRACVVIQECLTWALETGQEAGVWGGLSEDERRALKRRNARNRDRLR